MFSDQTDEFFANGIQNFERREFPFEFNLFRAYTPNLHNGSWKKNGKRQTVSGFLMTIGIDFFY